MIIALISPDEFQTIAIAWIGVLTAVVGAVAFAAAKIGPMIKDITHLFVLHDANSAKIAANSQSITDVALATPSVVSLAPAPLVVRPNEAPNVNNPTNV
jgi:hypothetical protein